MVKYFYFYFILFLFFLFSNNNTLSANLTLKDKFKKATQGDFVVTYKNKTYTPEIIFEKIKEIAEDIEFEVISNKYEYETRTVILDISFKNKPVNTYGDGNNPGIQNQRSQDHSAATF